MTRVSKNLRRHVAAGYGTAVLLAILYWFVSTPAFYAEATLKLLDVQSELSRLHEVTGIRNPAIRLSTEMQVIRSASLVSRSLDDWEWRVSIYGDRYRPGHELLAGAPFGVRLVRGATLQLPQLLRIRFSDAGVLVNSEGAGAQIRRCVPTGKAIQLPGARLTLIPARKIPSGAVFYLRLNARPEVVRRILRGLKVSNAGKPSAILAVSVIDANPVLAALAANAIVRQYIRDDLRQKRVFWKMTIHTCNRELEKLAPDLRRSAARIALLRAAHSLDDPGQVRPGPLLPDFEAASQTYAVQEQTAAVLRQKRAEAAIAMQTYQPGASVIDAATPADAPLYPLPGLAIRFVFLGGTILSAASYFLFRRNPADVHFR